MAYGLNWRVKSPFAALKAQSRTVLLFLLLLVGPARSSNAFSLLGPFTPWMDFIQGYRQPAWWSGTGGDDIGGPMNLGEGYRWNVPVITYGFDRSFLDYFGSNGVADVERAIQFINDLPPASVINLGDYLNATNLHPWLNYPALAANLLDLKSITLSCLMEQMGLANPRRFVFSLSNLDFSFSPAAFTVLSRNYAPYDFESTEYVNSVLYTYWTPSDIYPGYIQIYPIDPFAPPTTSAASFACSGPGYYFRGLTFDDVGGLRYLLRSNNVAWENLLSDVAGSGTNRANYVDGALRPGIEKITLQRQPADAGSSQFLSLTNAYVDRYVTNGALRQQTLMRIVTQPDILFTVKDDGWNLFSRTGTTNWVNHGAPGTAGPGVIRPPIKINFSPLGITALNGGGDYADPPTIDDSSWGSFDNSTNPPTSYPTSPFTSSNTIFHFWLNLGPFSGRFVSGRMYGQTFDLQGTWGSVSQFQTSTDLIHWQTILSVTNNGVTVTYPDSVVSQSPMRYFRLTPPMPP